MIPVYATHASQDFNDRLHVAMLAIAADVEKALRDNLVALVVGGGYGRGEGAVLVENGEEKPYNDIDFTIVVKRKDAALDAALQEISRVHTESMGIDVDFSRPLTPEDVRRLPHWLMWYDLLHGHIVLSGAPDVLESNVPTYLNDPPPAIEATRLMLNRGAGLVWAKLVLTGADHAHDPDFVRRNLYKCLLALGDSLAITHGAYTTSYTGRDKRLADLLHALDHRFGEDLLQKYEKALLFKFRPDEIPAEQPGSEELHTAAADWLDVFLHIEAVRTGRPFTSPAEYTDWMGLREPEQHSAKGLMRNVVQAAKQKRIDWRYSRERLFRMLPKLMAAMAEPPAGWAGEAKDFLALWGRFN